MEVNFKTVIKLKILTSYHKKIIYSFAVNVYQFLDKILLIQSMDSRIKGNLASFSSFFVIFVVTKGMGVFACIT